MQFVWGASNTPETGISAEKINLALRRTAHQLLAESGDTLSGIPAVEKVADHSWLVKLEHPFNYDRLPVILQESFDVHNIHANYDVAVLRCTDGELQLGYNFLDFSKDSSVPCGGRELEDACYNLQVTFPDSIGRNNSLPWAGWLVSGFLAVALFAVGQRWRRPEQAPVRVSAASLPEGDWLEFGQSRLDVANQVLLCGTVRHELTYREAKLLHLFVGHPNQLLERSAILQNVWADEGILVGRSVDMFVSRLRKMLRDDASLRLVAVHGVGYRLEVG